MVYRVFCDESRHTNEKYMVLGGVIIPNSETKALEESINSLRALTNMTSELKWTKITTQKYNQYEQFIDLFFNWNKIDKIHFHSLIVNTEKLDHQRFSNGDKELGFYKLYYQLLLHCFCVKYCRVNENDRFIINLDQRQTKYKLGDLLRLLNKGVSRRLSATASPVVSIEPIDSRSSNILQLTDILIGAVGFQKNNLHLQPHTRKAKKNTSSYIATKAGIVNLSRNTAWSENKFTIWNFKLQS